MHVEFGPTGEFCLHLAHFHFLELVQVWAWLFVSTLRPPTQVLTVGGWITPKWDLLCARQVTDACKKQGQPHKVSGESFETSPLEGNS